MKKGDRVKIVRLEPQFEEDDVFLLGETFAQEVVLKEDVIVGNKIRLDSLTLEVIQKILPSNCFRTLNSLYKVIYL